MPLLLNVLRNAEGPDYRKLRVKAMECAGLIGGLFFLVGFLWGVLMCLGLGSYCCWEGRVPAGCEYACGAAYADTEWVAYSRVCSGCLILIWGFGGICR